MKNTVLFTDSAGKGLSPDKSSAACRGYPAQFQEKVNHLELTKGEIAYSRMQSPERTSRKYDSHGGPIGIDVAGFTGLTPPERPARTPRTAKFSSPMVNGDHSSVQSGNKPAGQAKKAVRRCQSLQPSPFKGTVPEASSESESESDQIKGKDKHLNDVSKANVPKLLDKSPLHPPVQRGERHASIPKDVLTMMALKLGAPKRPPRTFALDPALSSLMSIKDGDRSLSLEKQFVFPNPGHRRASSADADAAQCWSRVSDLLFYHDELPIAMAIMDILPALDGGPDKKYLHAMIGIFTSNNQIGRLVRACANRAVKAAKSRKGLLDERMVATQTLLLYCSAYCDEHFSKILAPTVRGLCGPHRALESSLKGTCDRILSKVLSTSWPQSLRVVMKSIHAAACKKCPQSAWQVVVSFFMRDLLSNFVHALQISKVYEGEALDAPAARFLREVAQIFRRFGSTECGVAGVEVQNMNDWIESRMRHIRNFSNSLVSVSDSLETLWTIGSLAHGASYDYLTIVQLLTTHREEINRACTSTDACLQALISSRIPILWAAFDAQRNRRKSPSASYANARPHSETSSEATAGQLGLTLQVPAGIQARGQLWSIVTNATMPQRDENIRMEKMKISVNDVNLSRRALCHVPLLDQFQTLQSLNISHNRICDLTNLPRTLRHLDVSNNEVRDVSPLAALLALETCNLSHNHISDAMPGLCLLGLISLNLSHNNIETLRDFGEFPALENLHLDNNRLASTDEFKYVSKMVSPKILFIAENPVTADPLYFERIAVLIPSIERIDGRIVRSARHEPNLTPRDEAQGFASSVKSVRSCLDLSPAQIRPQEDGVRPSILWNGHLMENQNSGDTIYSKKSDPSELCFESDDETRNLLPETTRLQDLANLIDSDQCSQDSLIDPTMIENEDETDAENSSPEKPEMSSDIDFLLWLQIPDKWIQDEMRMAGHIHSQICDAAKVSHSRIRMNRFECGSCWLDAAEITILRAQHPDEDKPLSVFRNLTIQLEDPESQLLAGTLTRHTVAMQIKTYSENEMTVSFRQAPTSEGQEAIKWRNLFLYFSAKDSRKRLRQKGFGVWKRAAIEKLSMADEFRKRSSVTNEKRLCFLLWNSANIWKLRTARRALRLTDMRDIRKTRMAFFYWRELWQHVEFYSAKAASLRYLQKAFSVWRQYCCVAHALCAFRIQHSTRKCNNILTSRVVLAWKSRCQALAQIHRARPTYLKFNCFSTWAIRGEENGLHENISRDINQRFERVRQKRCWTILMRHMRGAAEDAEEEHAAEMAPFSKCARAFIMLSAFARWHDWQSSSMLCRELRWITWRFPENLRIRVKARESGPTSDKGDAHADEPHQSPVACAAPTSRALPPQSPCNTEYATLFRVCPSLQIGSDN